MRILVAWLLISVSGCATSRVNIARFEFSSPQVQTKKARLRFVNHFRRHFHKFRYKEEFAENGEDQASFLVKRKTPSKTIREYLHLTVSDKRLTFTSQLLCDSSPCQPEWGSPLDFEKRLRAEISLFHTGGFTLSRVAK